MASTRQFNFSVKQRAPVVFDLGVWETFPASNWSIFNLVSSGIGGVFSGIQS